MPVDNLREIRRKRGMTQGDLAEAADLEQGTISKMERGYDRVSLRAIMRIAQALEVHPADLFSRSELEDRVLRSFSRLSDDQKQAALVMIEALAARDPS